MLRRFEPAGIIECPNVEMRLGQQSTLSQVSVEPQVWQKPRVVPGEDLNLVICPFVTV